MSISTLQSISGEYIRLNVASAKFEYFYIGLEFDGLGEKLKDFHNGRFVESVDEAIHSLRKTKKYDLPSVFIFGDDATANELKQFKRFTRELKYLENIPVILLSNANMDVSRFKGPVKLVDEIIDIRFSEDILKKVKILTKAKLYTYGKKDEVKKIGVSQSVKRGLDILLSSVLLLLLSPVLLTIAILIKLEGRGPVFYVSKRAGRHYQIFNFIKFRTMQVGADKKIAELLDKNQYHKEEQNPLFFKLKDDPRVTRVGKFLRNTSLDELPQLINVLKGDMSLVGNRPLPLYEAATLTTDEYAARFLAPAGMTGLWQIKKRGQKDMSVEERINLDITYANQASLMYDFWIIANTPRALVQKESV